MLTLYHLTNSRSQRVIWLLEALNEQYEIILCERNTHGLAPDWLKTLHLLGKVPMLMFENNGKKIVLAETSAIFDFLALKFADNALFDLKGLNFTQISNYCYFKNFADSSLMPNLALKQIFARMVSQSPRLGKPVTGKIKQVFDQQFLNPLVFEQLAMIDNGLQYQRFLVDEKLMAVDILLEFMLNALAVSVPNFEHFSNISRYLQDLQALPSYQRAVIKGQFDKNAFINYWYQAW